jgi:hypothetical protein
MARLAIDLAVFVVGACCMSWRSLLESSRRSPRHRQELSSFGTVVKWLIGHGIVDTFVGVVACVLR